MPLPEQSPAENKNLFLPNSVLRGYGCRNCVWKSYGQCPHSFSEPDDIYGEGCHSHPVGSELPVGYCTELADFLFGLAEKSDSISAVKEKFFLYTQEMQAMSDHMEFQKLLKEYRQKKLDDVPDSQLSELIANLTSYRLWWERLTFSIIRGLGKIADRERRSDDVESKPKITFQQFNVLLKESDKYLEGGKTNG